MEICQHGAGYDTALPQTQLLASCGFGVHIIFNKDGMKFHRYTLIYIDGLAPEAGQGPKSLKTLKSNSQPRLLLGS